MSTIKAVLFDLDNTLLDRQTAFLQVAQAFYHSYPVIRENSTREEVVSLLMSWDAFGIFPQHPFERALDAWPDIGMSTGEMMDWYYEELWKAMEPDKLALALLEDLNKEGIPWGVVTNGGPVQHEKVKVAGLQHLAPFVIVSSDFGQEKPVPAIYHEALTALVGIPAENTLFVGDSPDTDIKGAQRVGILTAWVTLGRTYPEGERLPDYQIGHVNELRPLLLERGS